VKIWSSRISSPNEYLLQTHCTTTHYYLSLNILSQLTISNYVGPYHFNPRKISLKIMISSLHPEEIAKTYRYRFRSWFPKISAYKNIRNGRRRKRMSHDSCKARKNTCPTCYLNTPNTNTNHTCTTKLQTHSNFEHAFFTDFIHITMDLR